MMAGFDVHDATLGIVGFGAIGQAIARRARGFGMHTLYWNRTPRPEQAAELGVYLRRFDALLAESDFVSLSVALTEDTHHLIDAEAPRENAAARNPRQHRARPDRRRSSPDRRAPRRPNRGRRAWTSRRSSRSGPTVRCSRCRMSSCCRTSARRAWRREAKWLTSPWPTCAPRSLASRCRTRSAN